MQQPFENATAMLDFLEGDESERYVFRGQTRRYHGPMLPSGFRDRFTPFDTSTEPAKWAGISTSRSVVGDEVKVRQRDLSGETETGECVDDGKTTWDLPEAAYQKGFREFFNQSHSQRIRDIGNVLREGAIPGMSALLGKELADLLCQQYGFTSTALDVSTDPSVAMFFATHQAPFYSLVADSSHLGVVYRWPRERAMVAQDLLLPLEGSHFRSIRTSFLNFIKDSADIDVGQDTLMRYTSTKGERQKRLMAIAAKGERRSLDALRFPAGAFDRSRMGRQRAALLRPYYEVVKTLMPRDDRDLAVLIGDLLTTHHGEVFRFHHTTEAALPDRLNKFALWPSIRPTAEGPTADVRFELRHDNIEFEDLYLEMMLRFFSSCSPCDIIIAKLLEPGNPESLDVRGPIHGVVDLGYLLHPTDARLIAERLRIPETYTPIPMLRYIPSEHVGSLQAAFADAITS
ncbi:MAG: hypothetical protein ACYSWU_09790 [Planctomycetota bacterium]